MAMDIAQPMRFTVDIDTGLVTTPQRTHLNYGDVNANRIIVAVVRGKTPVDLTGVSATGSFYRPGDGARIPLEGDISANEASVTLIDHCYAAEGQYEAEVKLTQGSVTRTVLSITGYVHRAGSDVLVDVAGTVPSLDALLAQIQATKDAAAAANTAAENANAATTKANNAANTANSAASNADEKAQAAQTAADAANAAEQNWSNGTAANATKLNGKDAVFYLGARNLLHNSDFTKFVAQAGISAEHEVGIVYAGDRWILGSGTVTGVKNSTGDGYRTITLNGTIYQKVANTPEIATAAIGMVSGTAEIEYINGIVTITSAGGVIKWAVLYGGTYTADNLPPYVPKGYAAELAECQLYYENSWNGIEKTALYQMLGTSWNLSKFDVPIYFQQQKRTNPSMIFYPSGGRSTVQGFIKNAYRDVTILDPEYRSGLRGVYARVDVPETDLTIGFTYQLHAHWEACADL